MHKLLWAIYVNDLAGHIWAAGLEFDVLYGILATASKLDSI